MIRLSREQVRRVDQICIEVYGLPGIVLMENAARSAAEAVFVRFPNLVERPIGIVCGSGNNGGDGYALARHLVNRGCFVQTFESDREPSGDAAIQRRVWAAMKLEREVIREMGFGGLDLCIDALFGTGLDRPPQGIERRAIEQMNASGLPIVSLDLPSGLDCDAGVPLGDACVRADVTVTFVAEKLGFADPRARDFTGTVHVGDIGCPREVIQRVLRS